jgi:Zinc finger, C3HC4 type (RING finger)
MRGTVQGWEDPLNFRVEGALGQTLPPGTVMIEEKSLKQFEQVEVSSDDDRQSAHPLIIRFEPVDSLRNEVMYVMCRFKWEIMGEAEIPKIVVEETLHENGKKAWQTHNIYINNDLFKAFEDHETQEREDLLCIICFSELRSMVNMPCGHACVGEACIYKYFENGDNRECPVCRLRRLLDKT